MEVIITKEYLLFVLGLDEDTKAGSADAEKRMLIYKRRLLILVYNIRMGAETSIDSSDRMIVKWYVEEMRGCYL